MARDYKHAGRGTRTPPKKCTPAWLVFGAGLMAGLIIASIVWVREHGVPDFVSRQVGSITAKVAPEPAATAEPVASAKQAPEQKPKFDFYTILPEMEVAVPEWKLRSGTQRSKTGFGGPFVLQAGSFRNVDDAERLKAELALLGMESEIQSVAVNGRDTWHRVRIGPIADGAKVEVLRQRLVEHKIDPMLLRLKTAD